MKISYNWLKWYIPEAPDADKLADIITYHLAEVEGVEKREDGDSIFDIKILPNRAHDLLSHLGLARELASLLNINFVDPTPKYKIPESKPTDLKVKIESDKCKRYMGRIIHNVKIDKSPEWMKKHLEAIGQRSINNLVDATNIVMFNCGEPTHIFDKDKIKGSLVVREAREGEMVTTLDGKECTLISSDFVVSDEDKALIIGGVKGGKVAEVDSNTKNIILEVGNFDAVAVRKTSTRIGVRTEGSKRWENGVSPELASYGMRELSALIAEMCPDAIFEEIVDVYPVKQEVRKLSFSADKISRILGLDVSMGEVKDILKRYKFEYTESKGTFEMIVPPMRLDLVIEEDMAEEIGRILGYDKVKPVIPKINFTPKINETYAKIIWARNKLLEENYSEVMTYAFAEKGEVEVLESASDKKFLRTNLSDELQESMKLNKLNIPLLGLNEASPGQQGGVKIFEIGTVFLKNKEQINIAYNQKDEIKEKSLDEFITEKLSPEEHGYFSTEKFLVLAPSRSQVFSEETSRFKPWSPFPFIARDIAVWVPENISSEEVKKVIKNNAGDQIIRGPELFDQFKKDRKVSYAFRLVFQSYDRTLTDVEVNEIMHKISNKIKENSAWQVR